MNRSTADLPPLRRARAASGAFGAAALLASVISTAVSAEQIDIEQVIVDFGFPADTAARVRRGEMLEADPKESSERELAVGLTFLVKEPPAMLAKAFRKMVDAPANPQLAVSVRIRDAGSLPDFDRLVLKPNGDAEAKRYLTARPGETLNLSADEIRSFNALSSAGGSPVANVEAQLARQLLARYQSYLALGLDGMAPYARASGPQDPSADLREAIDASSPLLWKYAPAMRQLLLSYPRDKPPGLKESFYWLRYDLDGRPNYTLRHRLALPVGDDFVVADREFYVSHGYNTSQAIAGLLPVPEGTIVFYRSRVSTDQVAGFGSSMKKGIGRGVMAKQMMAIFERSRAAFQPN
jgi:hypothetical protein